MKKISVLLLIVSMFSLTSCEVLMAVLEQAAQQQQQQQQQEQPKQPNQTPTQPKGNNNGGSVLKSEKDKDKSKTTINDTNSELYSQLNMSKTQINKYESIIAKYKAQTKKLYKAKRSDRPALKSGLDKIKQNQDIELKNLFSAAQYSEYKKIMNSGKDKSRNGN